MYTPDAFDAAIAYRSAQLRQQADRQRLLRSMERPWERRTRRWALRRPLTAIGRLLSAGSLRRRLARQPGRTAPSTEIMT